ncbi:MAG: DUF3267 domain-containing protein [Pseudobutyrivibrio sp.]|nr:DUF3267 domain-containing protein [Pseudobutyrivibrio sp.]
MSEKKTERVLTEKEIKRTERVDKITEDLAIQGYERKDVTVSLVTANVVGSVIGVVFGVLMFLWYYLQNNGSLVMGDWDIFIMLVLLILMIFVHEGIHGIIWGAFAPSHKKAIEFGFIKEMLTPYCYCGEALSRGGYLLGSFMPCLLLGIIPTIAAIYAGSMLWLILGIFNFMGAGADVMITIKMLLYKAFGKDVKIMDHPTEVGFIVFEK